MKNFALIGDVHSHEQRLSQALSYCRNYKLTPILLGDLFDSRCDVSDSVGVYNLVREAEETMNAIVLQSNHQNKLIRYLKGNKVVLNHGLDKTVEEFKSSEIDLNELRDWLQSLPYGIVFRDKNSVEYRCAHAYFSSRIEVPEYEDCYLVNSDHIDGKIKNIMIYGPVNSDGRVSWWKSDRKYDYRMVSGHYHTIFLSEQYIVLDGQSGTEENSDPFLPLYDINKKILKKFF